MEGRGVELDVHVVRALRPRGAREGEARASAADFLEGGQSRAASRCTVVPRRLLSRPTARRSRPGSRSSSGRVEPDLILTHRGDDAHQDHREVSRLTWNTFRDHTILEYEIPKWDGDLGPAQRLRAGFGAAAMARKVELLMRHFGSQRSKHWFDEETFRGLARSARHGMPRMERYAEAFFGPKLALI